VRGRDGLAKRRERLLLVSRKWLQGKTLQECKIFYELPQHSTDRRVNTFDNSGLWRPDCSVFTSSDNEVGPISDLTSLHFLTP
jgi:hypothetical protein